MNILQEIIKYFPPTSTAQDKFSDGSLEKKGNGGKRRPRVSAKGQRMYQVAVKRFGGNA